MNRLVPDSGTFRTVGQLQHIHPHDQCSLELTAGTGPTITHCNIPGTIALTFDDGPSPYTEQVLDLLDQHGAKATFFVNGDNFGRGSIDDPSKPWPGLIRRMHNSGHQIGSHTWSHADLTNVDSQTRLTEVSRLETALVHILGFYPTYFRPPFAHCDAACEWDLGAMGYHVVNFDVDTKDYLHTTSEDIQISQNIFAGAVSGNPAETSYLVLSHDVWEQTARKLVPFMLNTLEQRGFKAVTVGECLGDPVENWYRS